MSRIVDMRLRTPKDLGAILRQRRHELGLSQIALAERVGVSRQWVIDVEAGKPRAELGLVLRALDALGLHLSAEAVNVGADDKGKVPAVDIDAIVRAARKPRP